jgi:hypothetical protein
MHRLSRSVTRALFVFGLDKDSLPVAFWICTDSRLGIGQKRRKLEIKKSSVG